MDDAVPAEVNPDERRAFREGQFSARLDGHDRHFEDINGQLGQQASALNQMAKELGGMNDTVTGMALVMPKLQTVADEVQKAELVAETLRQKTEAERGRWDRWQKTIAWALGILVGLTVLVNFSFNVINHAQKPKVTVTVPDITPGGSP